MEVMVISQQEDAAHLVALLKKFTQWGMLRFYDMDAVFQGVENLNFRYFLLRVDELPLMDWKTFVDFLEQMHAQQQDPLRGLHGLSFLAVDGHGSRLHDFNRFASTIRSVGHP